MALMNGIERTLLNRAENRYGQEYSELLHFLENNKIASKLRVPINGEKYSIRASIMKQTEPYTNFREVKKRRIEELYGEELEKFMKQVEKVTISP